jgi:hypothetical protein
MRTGQRITVPPPDFSEHLRTFERQNNLNWLPSVANVPALMALKTPSRTTVAPRGAPPLPRAAATGDRATPATRTSPREQRELGARIRNPSRHAMFTGNTAFANNVRDRSVDQAFAVAGGQDAGPTVV